MWNVHSSSFLLVFGCLTRCWVWEIVTQLIVMTFWCWMSLLCIHIHIQTFMQEHSVLQICTHIFFSLYIWLIVMLVKFQMDAKLPMDIFENVMQLAIEGCKAIAQYIRGVRDFAISLMHPVLPWIYLWLPTQYSYIFTFSLSCYASFLE